MFVNIAEPRGLCQACLGHSVAEVDTEKEVDTKNHAEENDEKRETFEDLPEHLKRYLKLNRDLPRLKTR